MTPPIVLPAPTLAEALDPATRDRRALALIDLTTRERQVAELLADGHTTDEIAAILGIGRRWVGRIISHLCTRTQAGNRTHLVARLLRAGKIR